MLKKSLCIAVAGAVLVSGCATVGPDGKEHTDTLKTTGAGAAAGAVIGALIGGQRGAVIGAAIGGGVGYLVALDARKKELAEAQQAAADIQQDTGFKPKVATQTYKDKKSGQTAKGLKQMDFNVRTVEVVSHGQLTDKASMTLAKLNKLSSDNNSQLVVVLPRHTSQAVVNEVREAAPNAKIAMNGPVGRTQFKVLPGKIEGNDLMTVG